MKRICLVFIVMLMCGFVFADESALFTVNYNIYTNESELIKKMSEVPVFDVKTSSGFIHYFKNTSRRGSDFVSLFKQYKQVLDSLDSQFAREKQRIENEIISRPYNRMELGPNGLPYDSAINARNKELEERIAQLEVAYDEAVSKVKSEAMPVLGAAFGSLQKMIGQLDGAKVVLSSSDKDFVYVAYSGFDVRTGMFEFQVYLEYEDQYSTESFSISYESLTGNRIPTDSSSREFDQYDAIVREYHKRFGKFVEFFDLKVTVTPYFDSRDGSLSLYVNNVSLYDKVQMKSIGISCSFSPFVMSLIDSEVISIVKDNLEFSFSSSTGKKIKKDERRKRTVYGLEASASLTGEPTEKEDPDSDEYPTEASFHIGLNASIGYIFDINSNLWVFGIQGGLDCDVVFQPYVNPSVSFYFGRLILDDDFKAGGGISLGYDRKGFDVLGKVWWYSGDSLMFSLGFGFNTHGLYTMVFGIGLSNAVTRSVGN